MTRTSKIIAAGFLIRAFVAQALFWISYFHLPFARSLQLGKGFWFFAEDGPYYLLCAKMAASDGLYGIVTIGPFLPSRFFLQVLGLLILVLGPVASLAILLNCAAYVGTCVLLVRMRRNDVVIAAVTFSPAALLFSLQLLKDTLFFFLMVLMIALFRRWQESWRGDGPTPVRTLLISALGLWGVLFALAGIRWYFAVIVWGVSALFFLLAGWPAKRRVLALAAGAMLFVLLSQAVRIGAVDTPPEIARLLNPATALGWRPETTATLVEEKRFGFDTTPAATTIVAGPLLAPVPPPASDPMPPAIVATSTAATATTTVVSAATSATPATTAPSKAVPIPAVLPPSTFAGRAISGFAATFLPRVLAQAVGLIRVGGGRGLWLFAEADTVVFDLVLLYVLVSCARALRRGTARWTPLFVFVVLVFILTAGPMVYTVNNFGTIFRLRQMLYILAAVAPLTLRWTGDDYASSR